MRTSQQIDAIWSLSRERSAEGERLRRRVGALAALALLVCGFLASIGLGLVVLAFLGGLVLSVGIFAAVALWPNLRPAVDASVQRGRSLYGRGSRRVVALRPHVAALGLRATALGPRVTALRPHVAALGPRVTALRPHVASLGPQVSARTQSVSQWARRTALRFAPGPARLDPQREAIGLNAAGTQHRRSGRYKEAVEAHRAALEILRELGDRRGVALTQSNLALALSRFGDHDWAIELFEEAAATLRDLGDEEHEAQIMANLGLAHRRHGRREEGDNVLELALAKLSPESSTYHQIEAELRRAS